MADLYDYPDIYDERFTDAANNAYKAHYQKMFAGKNIETILDCSFGTGCLTLCLSELGYHVSGSDLSEKMLRRAQDKAIQKELDIDFVQCDFRELSSHFKQMFDCVMSTGNALAHVTSDEIRLTLREMDRLVRSGGYIYFDSRNWDKELKDKKHFRWGNPFIRQDGVRINYVQNWEYHSDGSVKIHILQGYEKDGRIYDSVEFEEQVNPFPVSLVCSALNEMGYKSLMLKPCPWFDDKPFEQVEWYCLMAQKPQTDNFFR